MKRKNRSLASFDSVADINTNENNNDNVNVNINDNKKVNIEDILETAPKKELVGIYFDADIARELDNLSKGKPRGTKSKLVNEAMRKLLKELGRI